jgi:hypothetical protein
VAGIEGVVTWADFAPWVGTFVRFVLCALGAGGGTHLLKGPIKGLYVSRRIAPWLYRWSVRSVAALAGAALAVQADWPTLGRDGWGLIVGLAAGGSAAEIHRRVFSAADAGLSRMGVARTEAAPNLTSIETGALRTDDIETLGG